MGVGREGGNKTENTRRKIVRFLGALGLLFNLWEDASTGPEKGLRHFGNQPSTNEPVDLARKWG